MHWPPFCFVTEMQKISVHRNRFYLIASHG